MLIAHQDILARGRRCHKATALPRSSFWLLTLEIGNLLVVVKKEGAEEGGIFICSAEDKYLGLAAI